MVSISKPYNIPFSRYAFVILRELRDQSTWHLRTKSRSSANGVRNTPNADRHSIYVRETCLEQQQAFPEAERNDSELARGEHTTHQAQEPFVRTELIRAKEAQVSDPRSTGPSPASPITTRLTIRTGSILEPTRALHVN